MSTLGVIFEDFYMCVSLIYKEKHQDNYSIFNVFLTNYTQSVSLSNKKMARGSVVKGLSRTSNILKFLILPFLDSGSPANLVKCYHCWEVLSVMALI